MIRNVINMESLTQVITSIKSAIERAINYGILYTCGNVMWVPNTYLHLLCVMA